jgi:potassium efflux system protein
MRGPSDRGRAGPLTALARGLLAAVLAAALLGGAARGQEAPTPPATEAAPPQAEATGPQPDPAAPQPEGEAPDPEGASAQQAGVDPQPEGAVPAAESAGPQRAGMDTRSPAIWDGVLSRAESRIGAPGVTAAELDALRARMVQLRSEAQTAAQAMQPSIDELNKRLQALGPAPAEGAAPEAPEIAQRRAALLREIGSAQVPLVEAQEAKDRADAVIAEVDRMLRARFSAELMSRGPTPLRPATWTTGLAEIGKAAAAYRDRLAAAYADPVGQRLALNRLPLRLLLVGLGLAIALVLRRWLSAWIEAWLARTTNPRAAAWAVALRNLTRLLIPAAGLGLVFAAFDPEALVDPTAGGRIFALPPFAMLLIGAAWLAASLLAPGARPFRLVPLDDAEARSAARLVVGLGTVAALALMASGLADRWELSPAAHTVMLFPLVLVGAAGLWRAAGLIDLARQRLAARPGAIESTSGAGLGLRILGLLVRLLQAAVIVAPVLAILGYLPAAGFIAFRSAMTLGLLGASLVVFDLLNRAAALFRIGPSQGAPGDGLAPVMVAVLLGLANLPLLAMVWGVRAATIGVFWVRLREGITVGGINLSAGIVLTLIVVFAIGVALTRLAQTLLRGTVLPRTRLDAGGRNAVVAGVGYVGFALAGLVAVSTAGLNLSSLAIVAGALSVGIGFGLQNVVSNFVSGIILLVERPVKQGDWIEVGGFSGYVKGINVRSTEIETFDRASVILPNSDLIAGTVLNRTHTGMSGRLQVPVSVTYDADPKAVEAILLSVAEGHPLVLEDPAPRVLFLTLGPDTMDFELRCWLRDVNFSLSARSDMYFEIVEKFAQSGVRTRLYGRELPEAHPGPHPEASAPPPAGAGTQPHLLAPEVEEQAPPPPRSARKPG